MRKKLDNISHGKPSAEPSSLKASQSSNSANIRTDVEETKQKLNVLAEKWKGVNSVKGFLTELWAALGIDAPTKGQQRGGNPSRYAAFRLQDGAVVIVTIRVSAHNADASNYSKEGNVNGDTNLSLVLQKRWKKNKFKPSVNVKLDEYVYVDDRIKSVENPLTQIANSLIGYLTNGKYVDTTGVAITHNSPTINESNTRKDMKTNKIKLSETQLKKMVSEAVRNVLRENDLDAQESIYQIICNLEEDIKTVISNTDSSANQAFGDAQEKLNAITNSLSHIDANLAQQLHSTFVKLQEVITELRDIRISLKSFGANDSYWGHPFKTTNGTVGLSNYSR